MAAWVMWFTVAFVCASGVVTVSGKAVNGSAAAILAEKSYMAASDEHQLHKSEKSFLSDDGRKQGSKPPPQSPNSKMDRFQSVISKLESAKKSLLKDGTCGPSVLDEMPLPPEVTSRFVSQQQIALHSANILNNLFSSPSFRLNSPDFYQGLAGANLDSEPGMVSSAVAFARGAYPGAARGELYGVYAYRSGTDLAHAKDLSVLFNNSYDVHGNPGSEWFWKLKERHFDHTIDAQVAEIVGGKGADEGVNATAGGSGIVLTTEAADGLWAAPFLDCSATNEWIVTFAAPFFGRRGSHIEFKGAVAVGVPLGSLEMDQCNESDPLGFGGTHKCDPVSTKCVAIQGESFRLGSYNCHCLPNFYFPDTNTTHRFFSGSDVEAAYSPGYGLPPEYRCLPCPASCPGCGEGQLCVAQQDFIIRSLPLGVQALCMTVTLILALIVFKLRKSKVMASSMWTMLEMILLGAFLLYTTVMVRYFEPRVSLCLLAPWCRELGFAICYGAILLKIYRTLVEFRTRKAHRWVIKDKDLLKYLSGIVVIVTGYMAAWTASTLDYLRDGHNVLAEGRTPEGTRYAICRPLWWEYVSEAGELLLLLFGVYLSYHVRNAVSLFHEKRCLCLAIYAEAVFSVTFYILRELYWLHMHPDYLFLMEFIRGQCTTTLILLIIFVPKLWFHHRPPRVEGQTRHLSTTEMGERGGGGGAAGGSAAVAAAPGQEGLKFADGITLNGEVDVGEINIAQMDPEDIRSELKRVYTQLQVLRDKTMRKDNPHISKRRGGRKATHRRFSLQKKGSKEKMSVHHRRHRSFKYHSQSGDGEHEQEPSKTPEDSVCSAEGPSVIFADGPSTYSDVGYGTPSVSFKAPHK